MRRVLLTASVDSHFLAFHLPCIDLLNSMGFTVDVAAKITYTNKPIPGVANQFDVPFERSPYKIGNKHAYKQLKRIINDNNYDIIHCHTPVASILTRIAARKIRRNGTKVIYTAHGFHFYKGAPFVNWLIYYPIEHWMARYTDVLITINKEDYERAKKFKVRRVEYFPGVGIDTAKFMNHSVDKCAVRKALGIPDSVIVVLSVGELNENKNHKIIIQALAELNNEQIHYIIAGEGIERDNLRSLSSMLGVDKQVHLLGLSNSMPDLYCISDIFCLPSKREGLCVSLMEAMASGLPVICSKIRGNIDLIISEIGGFLCNTNIYISYAKYIQELANDKESRRKLGFKNKLMIRDYDIDIVMKCIKHVYCDLTA